MTRLAQLVICGGMALMLTGISRAEESAGQAPEANQAKMSEQAAAKKADAGKTDAGKANRARPDLSGPRADEDAMQGEGFSKRSKRRSSPLHAALQELELSDEQKQQVRDIRTDLLQRRRSLREQQGKLRADLAAAKKSGDEAQARAVQSQMKALRAEQPGPKDEIERVRAVLTETQRAQFDATLHGARQMMRSERAGGMDKGARMMGGEKAGKSEGGKKAKKNRQKQEKGKKQLDL